MFWIFKNKKSKDREKDAFEVNFKEVFHSNYTDEAGREALSRALAHLNFVNAEAFLRGEREKIIPKMHPKLIKEKLAYLIPLIKSNQSNARDKIVKGTHDALSQKLREQFKAAIERPEEYDPRYWTKSRFKAAVGKAVKFTPKNVKQLIRETFEKNSGMPYSPENMKAYFAEKLPEEKYPGQKPSKWRFFGRKP